MWIVLVRFPHLDGIGLFIDKTNWGIVFPLLSFVFILLYSALLPVLLFELLFGLLQRFPDRPSSLLKLHSACF